MRAQVVRRSPDAVVAETPDSGHPVQATCCLHCSVPCALRGCTADVTLFCLSLRVAQSLGFDSHILSLCRLHTEKSRALLRVRCTSCAAHARPFLSGVFYPDSTLIPSFWALSCPMLRSCCLAPHAARGLRITLRVLGEGTRSPGGRGLLMYYPDCPTLFFRRAFSRARRAFPGSTPGILGRAGT